MHIAHAWRYWNMVFFKEFILWSYHFAGSILNFAINPQWSLGNMSQLRRRVVPIKSSDFGTNVSEYLENTGVYEI